MLTHIASTAGESETSARSVVSVVSGNDGHGISCLAARLRVGSVYVGLDATGTDAVPNKGSGIRIMSSTATGCEIGGSPSISSRVGTSSSFIATAVVSGNSKHGIDSNAPGLRVLSVVVGLGADGMTVRPNGMNGINLAPVGVADLDTTIIGG